MIVLPQIFSGWGKNVSSIPNPPPPSHFHTLKFVPFLFLNDDLLLDHYMYTHAYCQDIVMHSIMNSDLGVSILQWKLDIKRSDLYLI